MLCIVDLWHSSQWHMAPDHSLHTCSGRERVSLVDFIFFIFVSCCTCQLHIVSSAGPIMQGAVIEVSLFSTFAGSRGGEAMDEGFQGPVHTRLRQAAVHSEAAKATEAVWMGWAQQSDSLLDEVMRMALALASVMPQTLTTCNQ